MSKKQRATLLERERRIFTVMGWIIDGVQDYLILKQAQTQWGINLRQAKRYLQMARENWVQDEKVDIETKRRNKIAKLQHLARTLKEEYKGTPSGIKAILAVERELIKLDPDLSVKRVNVNANVQVSELSPEEREKRIAELLSKYKYVKQE